MRALNGDLTESFSVAQFILTFLGVGVILVDEGGVGWR